MIELRDYALRDVVTNCLAIVEAQFKELESTVEPARLVPWEGTLNWRFTEQSLQQVLLQKLARQISGVKATDVLLLAGRLQEIGVIYRSLDEILEDIDFLVLGFVTGQWTVQHDAYVKYFWSESIGDGPSYRRKSIRAFVNRALGQADPSSADANGREIHSTFSDFVHARSHPIMGMVAGPPAAFELDSIFDASAVAPFAEQQPMYAYRCLMSALFVARVLLPEERHATFYSNLREFETQHAALVFPAGVRR